jgi:hypothetical protein
VDDSLLLHLAANHKRLDSLKIGVIERQDELFAVIINDTSEAFSFTGLKVKVFRNAVLNVSFFSFFFNSQKLK